MTYEQAITSFWEQVSEKDLDSTSIAMMLALLHIRQRNGFPAHCSVPNEWLEELLHVDIRTIRTARQRLIDAGLIGYTAGKARRQPVYYFEQCDEPTEIPIAQDWLEDVQLEQPEPIKAVEATKPKKRRSTKESTPSLFSEKELKPTKKREKKETPPPTLEDVRVIFKARGLSDDEAERFFYYYDAQDWVTSSGQKIKRLDSMVNRWLTNNHKDRKDGNDTGSSAQIRAQEAAKIIAELAAEE